MAFSYGWRGPNITKSGLVFYIDPGSPNSFFNKSGVTVKDISSISSTNTATLVNGPTYKTTNGGVITLDGSNDYCSTTFIGTFTSMTIQAWFFRNGNQPSHENDERKKCIFKFAGPSNKIQNEIQQRY